MARKSYTRSKSRSRSRTKSRSRSRSRSKVSRKWRRSHPRDKSGRFVSPAKARRSRRRTRSKSRQGRKSCPSHKFQRPKTHTCVTCKAFKLRELQQFARLLGIETRKKDRTGLCREIRKFVKPAHFGQLIDKIERRRSRVRSARRRASEKLARGEALFGGYQRPARKSIYDWASYESDESSAPLAPAAPPAPALPVAPPAPPAPAAPGLGGLWQSLFGGPGEAPKPLGPPSPGAQSSGEFIPFQFGGIPQAPPPPSPPSSPSISYSLPSFSMSLGDDVSLEGVDYDSDYGRFNPKPRAEFDSFYEYDEPYVSRRLTQRGRKSKKDWRDLVREGYFSREEVAAPAPVAPKAPVSKAPKAPKASKAEVSAEFVDDLEAIQDFISAYGKRKYKTDAARAAAMTRDMHETHNVTTDYGKWKKEPWNYDWEGIDTEKKRIEPEHFMPAFRKGGFLRELGKKERKEYF